MSDTDQGQAFSKLKGIPLEWLIATPLLASARSNIALAQVLLEFVEEIGFEKGSTGAAKQPRFLTFELERPYEDPNPPNQWKTETVEVKAPLLGLVPLPALLLQSVSIDLTVKVSTTVEQSNEEGTKETLSAKDSWGFGNVAMTGEVTASHSHRRQTDQSATYNVNVLAEQQRETEGMRKLMDVMASVIQPLPTERANG